MLEYILGAIVLLFGCREVYNLIVKLRLKSKLNDAQNFLDKERLKNAKQDSDDAIVNYHELRDAFLNLSLIHI